jgi:hypothetical protein
VSPADGAGSATAGVGARAASLAVHYGLPVAGVGLFAAALVVGRASV